MALKAIPAPAVGANDTASCCARSARELDLATQWRVDCRCSPVALPAASGLRTRSRWAAVDDDLRLRCIRGSGNWLQHARTTPRSAEARRSACAAKRLKFRPDRQRHLLPSMSSSEVMPWATAGRGGQRGYQHRLAPLRRRSPRGRVTRSFFLRLSVCCPCLSFPCSSTPALVCALGSVDVGTDEGCDRRTAEHARPHPEGDTPRGTPETIFAFSRRPVRAPRRP